jgi:hypothetical protein
MPILSQVLGPNGSGIHQQVLSIVISTQLVPATVHVPSDRVGAICFSIEITTLQPPDPHLGPRYLSSPPRSLIISSAAL